MHFVFALLMTLIPVLGWGQTNASDATLDGYVTDQTGAALVSASVIATNTATNNQQSTLTDEQGYYRFPLLPVGSYELRVMAPSFQEYLQQGIALSVGKQVRVNVTLELGEATDSVTVVADAPLINTSQPATEQVVGDRALRSLPITSRNIYNFHLLGPGVKGLPSTGFGTTQYLFGGLNRSVWTVDGFDNTQRLFSRQIRLVISTPESVQEMQVVSGGHSAEFGRAAGGVVNVISRSGGNDFHGSFFGMWRPDALIARQALAAEKADGNTWYTLAGNFSGPLKKDKLFFFINDEYNPLRIRRPITISAANAQALGLSAAQLEDSTFGETFHTPSAKLNFILDNRNSGFIRYNRFTNDQPRAGGGLTIERRGTNFEDRMNGGAVQFATAFSPMVLNEARFGINRRSNAREPFPDVPADSAEINILGVANIGANPLNISSNVETSWQLADNITWTTGRHTLKFGFDFQRTRLFRSNPFTRRFEFRGLGATAERDAVSPLNQYLNALNEVVDPATGRQFTYTQLVQDLGDNEITQSYNFYNWFVQDQFRLSPNFTLNLGVRYELLDWPVLDANAPFPLSREIPNDTDNFAPRVGFNFAPAGSGRVIIRGGYGLYYDTPSLGLALNGAQFNGNRIFNFVIPGNDPNAPLFPSFFNVNDDPAFSSVPPSILAFAGDFQLMYGHNATIATDFEVVRDLLVSFQYTFWGHRFGTHTRDINLGAPVGALEDGRPVFQGAAGRPNQEFRAINLNESGGTGNYHGFDVTVTKRFSGGVQFSTTYSVSRARGDSNLIGGALTDPTNREFDFGAADGDTRHSFVLQGLLAPSFANPGLKWMNGFELSTMVWTNSGFPVNVVAGSDLNQDLNLNDRPVGFERNSESGPRFFQMNARLSRRIKIREPLTLELMVEAEHLTNSFNAACSISGCSGAVVNRFGANDFGRVTRTRDPRRFQFGGRISF